MTAEFLVEEQRFRVKAEIQQAVQRALDVADVPALVADNGIHEGRVLRHRPANDGRDGFDQVLDVA
jgi:hypothetical protein